MIGREKIWTLAYADLALVAKDAEGLREMMERLRKFLEKKKYRKIEGISFQEEKGKEKQGNVEIRKRKYRSSKRIQVSGILLSKKRRDAHIQETTKKAIIAMTQVWGIGQRKFKYNFERRMMLFRSLR